MLVDVEPLRSETYYFYRKNLSTEIGENDFDLVPAAEGETPPPLPEGSEDPEGGGESGGTEGGGEIEPPPAEPPAAENSEG